MCVVLDCVVHRCFGMSFFFFSSRRRHTRLVSDWSSDVCSSDLGGKDPPGRRHGRTRRRVESSGRTARTPPVYLLTVSRPLELSLQSSFQLSLTVLVDYRSRAGI